MDQWTSLDTSIATVDNNGKATGVAAGSTTIQADTSVYGGPVVQVCGDTTSPPTCPTGSYSASAPATVTTCGDPPSPTSGNRGPLVQEYATYSVGLTPVCSDFTNNASTAHFTFSELNSGDYIWAILRAALLTGIETTRADNGGTSLTVTSGYRNPAHNASVGGSTQSQHMYGTAADLATGSVQSVFDSIQAAAWQAGACVEPENLSTVNHVHEDWRAGGCPAGWGANGGGSGSSGGDL